MRTVLGVAVLALGAAAMSLGSWSASASAPALTPVPATFVAESTGFDCWLTGYDDPNSARYELGGADLGYSLSFEGHVWWLFGDSHASNPVVAATRWPHVQAPDNDSIAYSTPTAPGDCPVLHFVSASQPVAHAYASPSVSPDPWPTAPGVPVSLRTNETPVAAVAVNGRMYATFSTDNVKDTKWPPQVCASCDKGRSTRSVMAVFTPTATNPLSFTGLYDLSRPPKRYAAGAKFVEKATALLRRPQGPIQNRSPRRCSTTHRPTAWPS
jgi:hypothetical protein